MLHFLAQIFLLLAFAMSFVAAFIDNGQAYVCRLRDDLIVLAVLAIVCWLAGAFSCLT